MTDTETKGMIFGLLGVIAFGLTLPMTKIVVQYIDPLFIGLGRSSLAAMIAFIILLKYTNSLPTKEQLVKLFIIALGVVIGFPVFTSIAMQSVPASHGAIVVGILPLATAVAGVIISNERPSFAFWIMSLLGTILVISYTLLQGGGSFHMADLALFIAVLSVSIGYALGGKLSKELGGWQVICWALVISFPFIIVPTINYMPKNLFELPASVYLSFLYLALISQLFGFFVWYKGLAMGGIVRVSQIQLLQTFITIFASIVLLNEVLDTKIIVFSILVVSTVWIGKKMPIRTAG